MEVQIEPSWKAVLQHEFKKAYFKGLTDHIKAEKSTGKTIYPPGALIFNAFDKTPFHLSKVVILGQDPYHGPGQAHGLCFSVPKGIRLPPPLLNIYKELASDIGCHINAAHGDLTPWARQGVLLLNASLTVRANEPNSHAGIGWAQFTDSLIQLLSEKKDHLVFILWGRFAQEKQALIDASKHLILTAAHPSPFSAEKGFFGCKHFSRTNQWLLQHGISPIDWNLQSPRQQ